MTDRAGQWMLGAALLAACVAGGAQAQGNRGFDDSAQRARQAQAQADAAARRDREAQQRANQEERRRADRERASASVGSRGGSTSESRRPGGYPSSVPTSRLRFEPSQLNRPGTATSSTALRTGERAGFPGAVTKAVRPPTPAELKRGFTGRYTPDGRALVKLKDQVVAVPASRIGVQARRAGLDGAAPPAQPSSTRWNGQQQAGVQASLKQLIAGNGLQTTRSPTLAGLTLPSAADRSKLRQAEAQASRQSSGVTSDKWRQSDGSWRWPINAGFKNSEARRTKLKRGTLLDRYMAIDQAGNSYSRDKSKDAGGFLAPYGTPFEKRALPMEQRHAPKVTYVVLKDLPAFVGEAEPWFDQAGGGTQYKFGEWDSPLSVEDLVQRGFLARVEND